MIKDLTFRGVPYKISASEETPQQPSWFSFEDESVVRDRDWAVSPGDVVLDVGSAYGSYALTALASGASLVHTWNPNAGENSVLRDSLALNGWADRVLLHEGGLWGRSGFLRDTDLEFSETEPVEGGFRVRALDGYDLGLPRLDWMKLDVEGAEAEVLAGAAGLIARLRPRILVENHVFKDPSIPARVEAVLSPLGYAHVSTHPYHGVSHSVWSPGP